MSGTITIPETQEEKRERTLINLKWKHLKVITPIIVSILGTTFTFGYFVNNEVNKVATSRLQIEIDKLKEDTKKNTEKVSGLENKIKMLNSNLYFFKIDREYYQATSDYKKVSTPTNLKKVLLAKKRYVKYLRYRRQLLRKLKNDTDADEMLAELSETAIFIDGNWYKVPTDVLIELNN